MVETQLAAIDVKEKESDQLFYDKMEARNLMRRAACNAFLSQFDAATKDFEKAKAFTTVFNEEQLAKLERDMAVVVRRKESNELKLKGDIAFAHGHLSDALASYEEALELDASNEYCLSNIGVIYLKRGDYDKCLEYTERALFIIECFHPDTKEFMKDNRLEIKLLMRRSKCYEEKENFEKAKDDLEKAQFLDKNDESIKHALKRVQGKLSTIRFDEYREKANTYLKDKMFFEAL